jgi:hypothetical protein
VGDADVAADAGAATTPRPGGCRCPERQQH